MHLTSPRLCIADFQGLPTGRHLRCRWMQMKGGYKIQIRRGQSSCEQGTIRDGSCTCVRAAAAAAGICLSCLPARCAVPVAACHTHRVALARPSLHVHMHKTRAAHHKSAFLAPSVILLRILSSPPCKGKDERNHTRLWSESHSCCIGWMDGQMLPSRVSVPSIITNSTRSSSHSSFVLWGRVCPSLGRQETPD